MEKKKLHIVSLSGGKDSTAMLLRMLEEGWPVGQAPETVGVLRC